MKINKQELTQLLNSKVELYNQPSFIDSDPINIPRSFSSKEDVEISGFLAASIAWGNRKSIISSAKKMLDIMDNSPHDFIMNADENDLKKVDGFVHRTFQSVDFLQFIYSLRGLYNNHRGLEGSFGGDGMYDRITSFKQKFFEGEHLNRTLKHVGDPAKGSACKRINMFLRWMVRKDENGVDFGIWDSISPSELMCPLDVHVARVARDLGLLHRKQNDWKATTELTENLRELDPNDPVKYDYALFGMGVFEKL